MSKKIYVGNLSYNTTEESLQGHFSQFGEVTSCKIITDKFTGRAKGFGFIEMANDDDATKAISELDGGEFDSRKLKVNEARPQEKREFRGGGGGGGNRW